MFEEPLAASASPGLSTLPAENQPPPAPAPMQPMGLGLAAAPQTAAAPVADQTDQEYLQSLPTAQKIGLALQAFSAGMSGAPNPVTQLVAQRQAARDRMTKDLQENIDNISKAYSILDRLPTGSKQYAAVAEMMKRKMPGFADAFDAHGTANDAKVRQIASVLGVKEAQDALVTASGGDPKRAQTLMADADFVKNTLLPAADQAKLPGALTKIQAISKLVQQAQGSQFKDANGRVSFTMSDLMAGNKALPPELQLDTAELQALSRHPAIMVPYGFKTDAMVIKEQEGEGAAPKMRTRIQGDQEIQEEWDAKSKSWKQIGTGPRFAKQVISVNAGADQSGLTPDAIKMLAKEAAKDRSVLANVGRGVQGAKDLRAVINQMSEDEKASGGGPGIASTRASFAADKKALDKIVPQLDALNAFENSVIAQGKVLVDLAKKVDKTGVPVVERWIRNGRQNVAGDTDVSDFNTQIRLFKNEASRAITNPNLTGVLTDSARHEMDDFLPGGATGPQVERVVKRIEADALLRKKSYTEQIDQIKGRMSGGAKSAAPAVAAPYSDPEKERRYQEWKARQAK